MKSGARYALTGGMILTLVSVGSRLYVAGYDSAAREAALTQREAINQRFDIELKADTPRNTIADWNDGNKSALTGLTILVSEPPGADVRHESRGKKLDRDRFVEGILQLTPTVLRKEKLPETVTLSTRVREGTFSQADIASGPVQLPLRPLYATLNLSLLPGLILLLAGIGMLKRGAHAESSALQKSSTASGNSKKSESSSLDTVISQAPPRPVPGPVTHSADTPDELIYGNFIKEQEIGKGNMGTVYLSRSGHEGDPNKYALKILNPSWGDGKDFRARFDREAKICLKLLHPNLVRAHQSGEKEGQLWMVMDYIEGRELTEWLQEKKHSEQEIAKLFVEVCEGLQYAHEQEIVHRDLKPSNIIVSNKNDRPVIADFGLARGKHYATITKTNTTLGTPTYMPPEQIVGGQGSPQGDLYSLGCIIHEALTGEPAFQANDVLEMLQKKLMGEKPRELTDQEAGPRFREILAKFLANEPQERYSSAREAGEALRTLL